MHDFLVFWLHHVFSRVEVLILVYFVVVNSFYGVQLMLAASELRRHSRTVWAESRWKILSSRMAPKISVIAPAFNEESTVVASVRSLLALHYGNLEVIVVNDGSKDTTLEILRENFRLEPILPIYKKEIDTKPLRGLFRSRLFPNLLVADKENGGKADSLNLGLELSSGELICAIDADTLIEPDALQRMVRPFLLSQEVLAAGGTIRVLNDSVLAHGNVESARVPRKPIAGFQAVEYLRAFLFGRLGWNRMGGNLIISGAFGLFRRESVVAVGGYQHDTVGEDMELVLRLRVQARREKRPDRVEFIPDPVAWTEVPESWVTLGRQRDRWHRGLAQVLWRYRSLFFNPRYGSLGLFGYPNFIFIELLAPVVEMLGLLDLLCDIALGAINVPFAILFFFCAYGYGLILSMFTVLMDEVYYRRYQTVSDRILLFLWAMTENLGYRQLTVFWRLRGLVRYLRGRTDWGAMQRRGIPSSPSPTSS